MRSSQSVAQPTDVVDDGVDVLLLFLLGVGVIEAQIGVPPELIGEPEIQADRLGVADVQVAVGLGRKAGLDAAVEFVGLQVSRMMSRMKFDGRSVAPFSVAAVSSSWVEVDMITLPQFRVAKEPQPGAIRRKLYFTRYGVTAVVPGQVPFRARPLDFGPAGVDSWNRWA